MGSAVTRTTLRGLLVPDPQFRWTSFDAASSTLTQAGSAPGVPEAQDETSMVLEAVGDQADGAALYVRTQRGGHPGVDDARFVWRDASSADWRGWDPPCTISGFQFVDWSTTAGKWTHPHAVTLADGTVACAVEKSNQKVVVQLRDPDAGTWTEVEVYDRGSAYTYSAYPTLVVLPSGRLLCFFWRENASRYQVRMAYSDDNGASWTTGQRACLPEAVDTATYTPKRLRAAHLAGQICLVAHLKELATPEDQIHQWASNDLGATFDKVDELTGNSRGYPDLVAANGVLVMGYITDTATTSSTYPPAYRIIGSAYQTLTSGTSGYAQADSDPMVWATRTAGVFTSGDLALWVDEDGALYILGTDHDAGGGARRELSVRVSTDEGATWSAISGGPAPSFGVSLWRGQDAATYPSDYTVTAQRGRGVMLHRFEANPGTADDSLCCTFLGGYTTVCLPQEDELTPDLLTVSGWPVTWLPFDLPEDTGDGVPVWSHTHTGTAALTSAGLHLTTGNPQTEKFFTPGGLTDTASTVAQGFFALAELKLVDNQCRVELRLSDATPIEYEVAVIVEETKIVLWDLKAGAEVAHVTTTAGVDAFVQVLVALAGSKAKAWYRSVDHHSPDREWTLVGSTTSLTSAASNTGNRIRWGQSDDSESYWRLFAFCAKSYVGEGIDDQVSPTDLFGRAYQATPIYVDGGTSIQAVDGPTYVYDDWTITPRYTRGVELVHPEVAASPRRTWRSTTDADDVELMWDIEDSRALLASLIGIHLAGANFADAYLEIGNGMAWNRLANLDLRVKAGLKYTRKGRVVVPDVSGGGLGPFYFPTNILAGSHMRLGGKFRRIAGNAAGSWLHTASTLGVRILLDDVDGTEPTSGSNGEIWTKDYTCVIPYSGAAGTKLRLIIPAQTTAEGYFELGAIVLGQVHLFGLDYGWGRSQEWAAAWEKTEGRSGVRTVRQLAPVRRAVEFGWTDGVDTHPLTKAGFSPDYVAAWTGGDPAATPADTGYSLAGLYEVLAGAVTPVVYLPAIPVPTNNADNQHITNRAVQLYGRVVSESLKMDTVLGDEWGDPGEVLRVNTVRIEEEI